MGVVQACPGQASRGQVSTPGLMSEGKTAAGQTYVGFYKSPIFFFFFTCVKCGFVNTYFRISCAL